MQHSLTHSTYANPKPTFAFAFAFDTSNRDRSIKTVTVTETETVAKVWRVQCSAVQCSAQLTIRFSLAIRDGTKKETCIEHRANECIALC